MIGGIFKPVTNKGNVYQFLIGYQHLIVIELKKKTNIIFDNLIEKLILKFDNIYFFSTFYEMEQELDCLITNTNENFIVILC